MTTAGPPATVIYTIRPTYTMLVPAGAARVMPQAVPVDDVVVIYPDGIAAFPGLATGRGFFRVDTLLLTYCIEACAAEYANRVLVEERPGVYRALGCAAAEVSPDAARRARPRPHCALLRRRLPSQDRLPGPRLPGPSCAGTTATRSSCASREAAAPRCLRLSRPTTLPAPASRSPSSRPSAKASLSASSRPPWLLRPGPLAGSSNDVAPAQHAQHARPLKPIRGNGFGPARPEPGCGRADHGSSAEQRAHAAACPGLAEQTGAPGFCTGYRCPRPRLWSARRCASRTRGRRGLGPHYLALGPPLTDSWAG